MAVNKYERKNLTFNVIEARIKLINYIEIFDNILELYNQLRIATNKVEDTSVKNLSKDTPIMRNRFESIGL